MPRLLPAAEIPLIRRELAFCLLDEERLEAVAEADTATSLDAEFVAVSVAVHLWEAQQARLKAVTEELEDAAVQGYDVQPAQVWLEAWMEIMSADLVDLAHRNNDLARALGKPEADRIGLERAKPRIDAVVEEIQEAQRSAEAD